MTTKATFSDLVEINPNVPIQRGHEYPFVAVEDVIPGRRYVTANHSRRYSGGGSRFQADDVLFARITPCLENGKIAQFRATSGQVGFGSTEFFVFRHRLGISDPAYVFYLVYTDIVRNPAEKSMKGASGRQRADIESIKNLQVPAPSLPVQRKIATILSTYDDLIENNLRRIKILEEMAQTLYREWFVNFRFPGHERARMVESGLGPIPEGWEVAKVGNLLTKVPRKKRIKKKDYELDGQIPVVDQGHQLIGGYTSYKGALHDCNLPIIVFGDHTRILKFIDFPFACGADGTQLLRSNTERMPSSLFFYSLNAIGLSNYAYARHFKFLKEKEILVPDLHIARLFARVVDEIRKMISSLLKRDSVLLKTRDMLLPKLISGELDVSDLDMDTMRLKP